MTTYIFTAADRNYLPKVRLLAESVKRFHPSVIFILTFVDKLPPEGMPDGAWDEVLLAEDLEIDNWPAWAFAHRVVELATAVKPFALRRLLNRPGCRRVFYFDPDIVVYSSLEDLLHFEEQESIKLTPHQIEPNARWQDVADHEISSLRHGAYNLGFIGVNNTPVGMEFAGWWAEMLYWFCRDDIASGLFTDQKWIDLVPSLFPEVVIVRNPRFNVAPWNISTRTISRSEDGRYLVNGLPLGFYHFTGFDRGAHRMATLKYQSVNTALTGMLDWYEANTKQSSAQVAGRWLYGSYSNGQPILDIHRLVYRYSPELQRRFPNPFDCDVNGKSGYFAWVSDRSSRALQGIVNERRQLYRYRPTLASAEDGSGGDNSADLVLSTLKQKGGARFLIRQAISVYRRDGVRLFLRKLAGLARRLLHQTIHRR